MNELQHYQNLEQDKQYARYFRAYSRKIKEAVPMVDDKTKDDAVFHQVLIQATYLGVQTIIRQPKAADLSHAKEQFKFASILKNMLSSFTMRELVNTFPIAKRYDGEKYETRDYWSTKQSISEYMKKYGLNYDDQLGENVLELLYEYENTLLMLFTVECMSSISNINSFTGGISLFEEFAASQGHETTNTFKDAKGHSYYVQKGKPVRIKSSKANHLKLVK